MNGIAIKTTLGQKTHLAAPSITLGPIPGQNLLGKFSGKSNGLPVTHRAFRRTIGSDNFVPLGILLAQKGLKLVSRDLLQKVVAIVKKQFIEGYIAARKGERSAAETACQIEYMSVRTTWCKKSYESDPPQIKTQRVFVSSAAGEAILDLLLNEQRKAQQHVGFKFILQRWGIVSGQPPYMADREACKRGERSLASDQGIAQKAIRKAQSIEIERLTTEGSAPEEAARLVHTTFINIHRGRAGTGTFYRIYLSAIQSIDSQMQIKFQDRTPRE